MQLFQLSNLFILTMNEQQLRRRLRDDGKTPEEIEDAVDNWASDWYDRQKDYEVEDRKENHENH